MRREGRSAEWVRRCGTVLSRALELPRKRGLIESNPCRDAARPRATRVKPFSPTSDDVRKLIAFAHEKDPEIADVVTLLATTGMRKGELQALTWADVDLEKAERHVAASLEVVVDTLSYVLAAVFRDQPDQRPALQSANPCYTWH
jgi:integrase